MPTGTKSVSNEAKALVVQRYAEAVPLTKIAAEIGIDPQTIAVWRVQDPEFNKACLGAQEVGFEIDADSLKTIPDTEPDAQKARLKSENIRWLLARRAAHRYGDRLEMTVTGQLDLSATLAEARARMLPRRDSADIQDAEIVETTQPLLNEPTDCKSDAREKPEGKQECSESNLPDIWS